MRTGDFVTYQERPALIGAVDQGIATIALPALETLEVPVVVLEPVEVDGRPVNFIHALMAYAANVGVNLEPGRGISRPSEQERKRTDE